ncbi:MAG: tetratricopeptide repeat protein [Bacteroidetes bacterium]|nr:MAG: tetratricopeptide repeat protein [Bacteroidota bacterium]
MLRTQLKTLLGLTAFLFGCALLPAQKMEMHSSSPEAIALMEEALDNMGHDMQLFGENVDAAVEADPDMLIANFFAMSNPDEDKEAARPYVERMLAYDGPMSAGEKIFAEMATHFDEDDYNPMMTIPQLAEAHPEDARMYLLAGVAHMYSEQPAKAVPFLKKAIDMGPMLGAYNMLGYAYMTMGQMEDAGATFEAYVAAAPDHHNPYDSMGDYYMAMEDYAAAAEAFEKAVAINPDATYSAEKAKQAREKAK